MSLLRFESVSLARGGRLLFEDLSLSVGPGDALHICGPNGAGKSSLLRLAAGLLRPLSGRVEAIGAGLADGNLALDGELPLRSALSFWARLGGRPHAMDEAMAAFGVSHLSEVPVRMLSTGQARRASLVRLATSPAALWLLDEPLNGLDSEGVGRLADAVAKHRQRGGGVVSASHLPLPWPSAQLELGR